MYLERKKNILLITDMLIVIEKYGKVEWLIVRHFSKLPNDIVLIRVEIGVIQSNWEREEASISKAQWWNL